MMSSDDLAYLQQAFDDLLNYEADDPLSPIDPLTYRSPEGDSCLHISAGRGDLRAVQLLVEAGLDVNQRGDMGNTPLHYSNRARHTEVVEYLVSKGAAPSAVNEFGESANG